MKIDWRPAKFEHRYPDLPKGFWDNDREASIEYYARQQGYNEALNDLLTAMTEEGIRTNKKIFEDGTWIFIPDKSK